MRGAGAQSHVRSRIERMVERLKFYIDGEWRDPAQPKVVAVINPATEEKLYDIAAGSAADVDRAVAAARAAFDGYASTSKEERIALMGRIIDVYKRRMKDIAAAISDEMGAPVAIA